LIKIGRKDRCIFHKSIIFPQKLSNKNKNHIYLHIVSTFCVKVGESPGRGDESTFSGKSGLIKPQKRPFC